VEALDLVMRALDEKKREAPNGEDYWKARDIQQVLGYTEWRNFQGVIEKARLACDGAGVKSVHHFVDTNKVIESGKGAKLERADCYLTRYACYLIAMNAESSKPEVATAQTYFAVQTRRQEISDQEKRIALRDRVRKGYKILHVRHAAPELPDSACSTTPAIVACMAWDWPTLRDERASPQKKTCLTAQVGQNSQRMNFGSHKHSKNLSVNASKVKVLRSILIAS